jgi:CheY-like chemotaxis protein
VLVVEAHVALADRIGEGLRDAGLALDVLCDRADAVQSTTRTDYDVVVLDRDLPSVHGDRVCRRLVHERSPTLHECRHTYARLLMASGYTLKGADGVQGPCRSGDGSAVREAPSAARRDAMTAAIRANQNRPPVYAAATTVSRFSRCTAS